MSRAYTAEEVRGMLIDHMRAIAKYWAEESRAVTAQEKCDGVVFSILNIFDGNTFVLPALDIVPCPHESDKEFHQGQGENWFEPVVINNCQLHEQYYVHNEHMEE